jgi:hypothetical protein
MQQPHKLSKDTAAIQTALAEVCRSGIVTELPGTTSPQRVETYRELIQGNFEDTLARAYPITKQALRSKHWNEMVDAFMAGHPSSSPQLWRMPEEFCHFAIAEAFSEKFKVPYLDDLMRFEWVEIEVFMMEDVNPPRSALGGDLRSRALVINHEFRTLTVEYPVYESIGKGFSRRKGVYELLTFRNPESLFVEYMLATPLVLELLKVLAVKPVVLTEALEISCRSLGIAVTDDVKAAALTLAQDLFSRGMILGTVN